MKNKIIFILALFLGLSGIAQSDNSVKTDFNQNPLKHRPKLLVGIVVDQMRYDFLTRFYDRYGEGGFKRMMNEGFNCRNNHFNYIPTFTAPGHASIFTGTTPSYHGIIGNDWFSRQLGRNVYCVNDTLVKAVGTEGYAGEMSPHRMLTTTFPDENRLYTQMKGKTIAISIKDRGAILPGGHTANAAYWFDMSGNGNWVSSTFYMDRLPKWVEEFNNSDITESYFKEWNTYYPIDTYTESGDDINNFEGGFSGKEINDFPYPLDKLKETNSHYNIIVESPYGNNLTTDFAIAAIRGEQLGVDNITDILTISYSSTDKVGHNFGPNSKEIEDTYIRLDQDLARLFKHMDEVVGKGEYTVFLTADHGAPEVPAYLSSLKIPSGLFDLNKMRMDLNVDLNEKYGQSQLILSTINNQIYLDHDKIMKAGLDMGELKDYLIYKLLSYSAIDKAYDAEVDPGFTIAEPLEKLFSNGFNQKRSGDILFQMNPSYFKDSLWNRTGTDHGTGLNYDTHVPLLFFGKGITHGATYQRTEIIDIAPTMSALLGISYPNGSIGHPLEFIFRK